MHTFHYIVGDIHGCYLELCALEEKIQAHATRHGVAAVLVSVGDLIDRGPQSAEVVTHFLRGAQRGTHIAVGGNHEASLFEVVQIFAPHVFMQSGLGLEPVNGRWPLPRYAMGILEKFRRMETATHMGFEDFSRRLMGLWIEQGGRETLESFGCDVEFPESWQIDPALFSYLYNLPLLWENENIVVTHAYAGPSHCATARTLDALSPHESERSEAVLNDIEILTWNRVPPAIAPFETQIHVSGHTPRKLAERWAKLRTVAVDTGCAYGNALSAWCSETDEFLVEKGPGSADF